MKRFLPILLSLAILCTMTVIPTVSVSASSFIDSLYLNADYTKETLEDSKSGIALKDYTGKDKPADYSGPAVSFETATANAIATLPEGPTGKVARFLGGGLAYEVDMTKIAKNFTCEVYFRTTSTGWGLVCGSFFTNNTNYTGGWGVNVGVMSANGVGVAGNVSVTEANGTTLHNSPALFKKSRNNWTHVVYVNDGTNSSYYINGELIASEACFTDSIPARTLAQDSLAGFRVGSYRPQTDQFSLGSTSMPLEIAFVRLYTSAATANDVSELFNARNSGDLPSYTDEPTATPAVTPTQDPGEVTPAPTGGDMENLDNSLYFNIDVDAGAVDDLTGNYSFRDEISGADVVIEDDAELGKKVLVLEDAGNLIWENNDGFTFQGYDLTSGFTMEQLLYINTDPDEFKQNQTFMELNFGSIHFQEYNDGSDHSSGFRLCSGTDAKGNFEMCNAYTEELFPHKQWIHIVGTSDGVNNYYYLNGQLAATFEGRPTKTADTRYGTSNAQVLIGESVYGSMFGSTLANCKVAQAKIYRACADENQVVTLYNRAMGIAPVPTEVPGEETPAPTPDVTPGPRPDVDVPTGDAYKVSFGDIPAFGAGDSVNVPLVISDITTESGIMGFDIVLNTNGALIDQNITDEDIQAANEGNESLSKLNGDKGKWSVSARTDAEGKLILTILDENAETVAKAGDEITINIPVKPTAAASEGEWVAVVTGADGTDGNVNTIEGSGAWALVTAPVATPTPEGPTEEPSQEPGEETPTPVPGEETPTPVPGEETPTAEPGEPTPTQAPSEPTPTKNPSPLNPSTFDPGILGLVAVSLSALVTTKRRKKD